MKMWPPASNFTTGLQKCFRVVWQAMVVFYVTCLIFVLYKLIYLWFEPNQELHNAEYAAAGSDHQSITYHPSSHTAAGIVNPYPFNFTMRPEPCAKDVQLVIVVHSAISFHLRRELQRNTWLNKLILEEKLQLKLRIVFVTGSSLDPTEQLRLEYEHELYTDILQSDFIDSYHNNTYKALSYMRWIVSPYGCPNANWVLKIDDDAFTHLKKLRYLKVIIKRLQRETSPNLYLGRYLSRCVIRDKDSKWYMSLEDWPHKLYPTWFQGLAYVLTPQLIAKLPPLALRTRYLFTDDVYVGILVSQVADTKIIKSRTIAINVPNYSEIERLHNRFVKGRYVFYHVPFTQEFYEWYHEVKVK